MHDGLVARVGDDVLHKTAIDLELVQRQLFEVRKRRVAGAKVIQREADSLAAQCLHFVNGVGNVVQHQAFGQLQHQPGRVGTAVLQGALHLGDEMRVAELARADVDGQHQFAGQRAAFPAFELQAGLLQHPFAQHQDQA